VVDFLVSCTSPVEALNQAALAFSARAGLQHHAWLCTGQGGCSLLRNQSPMVAGSGGTSMCRRGTRI